MYRAQLFALLALLIAAGTLIACKHVESGPLSDLVIDSVTYRRAASIDEFGDAQFYDEFTIVIVNIGDAPASGLLYVKNTTSKEDFNEGHYSSGQLVKDAETTIEPGEIFMAKIQTDIKEDAQTVRFIVNPEWEMVRVVPNEDDIEEIIGGTEYIYRIEESNYENNTFELEFD